MQSLVDVSKQKKSLNVLIAQYFSQQILNKP